MARRKAPELGGLPRAGGLIARAAYARAREAGIAVGPLLAQANLTAKQMHDTAATVVARDQARFLESVAEALDDDLLGLHVAQGLELRQAGLLYYVMASSATMGEALQRVVRYWSIADEGLRQQCVAGRNLDITLQHVGLRRHLDRHVSECWAAIVVSAVRRITALRLAPLRVRFVHPRAECPAELAEFFGGAVEFGTHSDDIRFARAVGDTPVVSADPYLNKVLVGYCEEALAHRRPVRGSFRARAENAIVALLPHAEASAAQVARRLGLSGRTFARRLAAEGLTFTALLDGLRLDLANRYLADPALSISQIAWLLGYQEVSAFSKAHKRWTGVSPSEARRTA
jgi:AraC-like DNA-binding protein